MTDGLFNQLIATPKIIIEPPKKNPIIQRMNAQNKMRLKSLDEDYLFEVYWKQNTMFSENFSVGLMWLPRDGNPSVTLMRCNGPHGYDVPDSHHALTHIHTLDLANFDTGKTSPVTQKPTVDYSTMEDAILYALKAWNIQGYEPYFTFALNTPSLFN